MKTLQSHPSRATALLAFVALALVPSVKADIIFNTATAYTDSFTTTYNASETANGGSNPSMDPTNSFLQQTAIISGKIDKQAAVALYNSSTTFQNEAISTDFKISLLRADSLGLYLRVNDATDTGVLALMNIAVTTGQIQLRLYSGASTVSAAVGTAFYNQTNLSGWGTLSQGGSYSLSVVQGFASGSSFFNISVKDNVGSVLATSGDISLTTTNTYDAAGGIALRLYSGTDLQIQNLNGTNVTAIPEPSMATGIMGGVALTTAFFGLSRRRARSNQN